MIDLWKLSPAGAASVTSADVDRWVATEGYHLVYEHLARVRDAAAYIVVGVAEATLARADDARLATPDLAGLRRAVRRYYDVALLMQHAEMSSAGRP